MLWGTERSREGERDHHSPGGVSEVADKPATDSLKAVLSGNSLGTLQSKLKRWGSRVFQSGSDNDPLRRSTVVSRSRRTSE